MALEAWAARSTGILRCSGNTGPEGAGYQNLLLHTRTLQGIGGGGLWTQVLASRQPVEEAT